MSRERFIKTVSVSPSVKGRFCPLCGKPVEKLIEGMCEDCYKLEHPLLVIPQEPIKIQVCKVCGAYRLKGAWKVPKSADVLAEAAVECVRRKLKPRSEIKRVDIAITRIRGLKAEVLVRVRGRASSEINEYYDQEFNLTVKYEFVVCPNCFGVKAKREVARVQIRALGRHLTMSEVRMIKAEVERKLQELFSRDRAATPIEVEELEGGIDYKFASKSVARALVAALQRAFPVEVLETHKDMGMDRRGRKATRVTYRVLFPPFREGDVVDLGGRLLFIEEVRGRDVRVLSLPSLREERIRIKGRMLKRFKVVATRESLVPCIILSLDAPHVQVLDLSNYEVKEVLVGSIPRWVREGGKAGLVKVGEEVYMVPFPA